MLYARMIWYLERQRYLQGNIPESAVSWARLERGFGVLLRRYPNSLSLKSEWARLCRLSSSANAEQRRSPARQLFTEIGDQIDDRIWSNAKEFIQFRDWAMAE